MLQFSSAWGQELEPRKESEVKAAYLFTFLKYLEFGEDRTGPIIITVVGKEPFSGALDKYAGREIKGRKVKIIYLDHNSTEIKTANKCDLLYIDDSAILLQKKLLQMYNPYRPLTIADNEWFLESGGMINLVAVSRKIRWEVNHKVIKDSEIPLSSKVLRLAVNKEKK
ncbi:YfiR family protein [Lentisphaera marina]|uniref:YfiR family protein n=1 Tax=Lentisphaera marina TaxID=1111041 RepID=UPI002366B665|nr:YfiR family protein [Lentisphaera marina]MDD7984534.1 YfiR family protein [Lentisphaera marina]